MSGRPWVLITLSRMSISVRAAPTPSEPWASPPARGSTRISGEDARRRLRRLRRVLPDRAAKNNPDPKLLHDWGETTLVPCCPIGGITPEDCGPPVEAGADFVAVIGALRSHPEGPRAGVAE